MASQRSSRRYYYGNLLLVVGLLLVAWPITMEIYGRFSQNQLEAKFEREEEIATAESVQTEVISSAAVSSSSVPVKQAKVTIAQTKSARKVSKPPQKTAPVIKIQKVADEAVTPVVYNIPAIVRVPDQGEPFARLRIPKIGLSAIVVEGTSAADLHRGPGHIETTGLPGEYRNCVIAGHRAYWFKRVPELTVGDPVWVETPTCRYQYLVEEKRTVTPDRSDLLEKGFTPILTLVTCSEATADSAHRVLVFCHLSNIYFR